MLGNVVWCTLHPSKSVPVFLVSEAIGPTFCVCETWCVLLFRMPSLLSRKKHETMERTLAAAYKIQTDGNRTEEPFFPSNSGSGKWICKETLFFLGKGQRGDFSFYISLVVKVLVLLYFKSQNEQTYCKLPWRFFAQLPSRCPKALEEKHEITKIWSEFLLLV